eukprot:Pompholyxophrys_punicea_v1_NODE_152_length_3178_cov_3.531540.p1 type:complete len:804 gc:universal NODE_152_length_3178_cov_3.531540:84-2495(+)
MEKNECLHCRLDFGSKSALLRHHREKHLCDNLEFDVSVMELFEGSHEEKGKSPEVSDQLVLFFLGSFDLTQLQESSTDEPKNLPEITMVDNLNLEKPAENLGGDAPDNYEGSAFDNIGGEVNENVSSTEEFSESEDEDSENINFLSFENVDEQAWFPFESKEKFLLSLLIHGGRHPVSHGFLREMWVIFALMGIKLPELGPLLNKFPSNVPLPKISKFNLESGKSLSAILPSEILRLILSNPRTFSRLALYPERTAGVVKQMWQAGKWTKNTFFQTPMIVCKAGNVFVGDFVGLETKQGIFSGKILSFFLQNGTLCFEMRLIIRCDSHWKPSEQTAIGRVSKILHVIENPEIDFSASTQTLKEEINFVSPLKIKSRGLRVLLVPMWLSSDETKANLTKKFKLVDSWLTGACGLSREENRMFKNIHFVCTSDTWSPQEMSKIIVRDFQELEAGVEANIYVENQCQKIMLVSSVMVVMSDNARASQLCNHVGARGRHFCRFCLATKDNSESIQEPRTHTSICDILEKFATLNEREKTALQQNTGLKPGDNEFRHLSNPDLPDLFPVEILHTVLLGPIKHLTAKTMKGLKQDQARKLEVFLKDFDYSGFEKVYGNIHKHHGSMVGRDFKSFVQVAVFALSALKADEKILNLWCYIAELVKAVYSQETSKDHREVIVILTKKILQELRITKSPLLDRAKWHLLLHIADNVELYGPASGFHTERQESLNGIIRHQLIYSNHTAPSLDTAMAFSKIEAFTHLLEGGRWGENLEHRAGEGILAVGRLSKSRKVICVKRLNLNYEHLENYD